MTYSVLHVRYELHFTKTFTFVCALPVIMTFWRDSVRDIMHLKHALFKNAFIVMVEIINTHICD